MTRSAMSIDRNSTGLPQVDPHKRTTQVNFSIAIGVVLFLGAMAGVVWWFATNR